MDTCVADTGIIDFYPDFMRLWGFDVDVFDREVFAGFPRYSRLGFCSIGCGRPRRLWVMKDRVCTLQVIVWKTRFLV